MSLPIFSTDSLIPSRKKQDVAWALALGYEVPSGVWTWAAFSFPLPSRIHEVNLPEAGHVLPEILPTDEDTSHRGLSTTQTPGAPAGKTDHD